MVVSLTVPTVAAFLGVISHLGYFMHGEHHREAWQIFRYLLTVPPLAILGLVYGLHLNVQEAVLNVGIALSAYLTAIITSILLYRGLFHRLRHFPGPFLAKLSRFYNVTQVIKRNNYELIQMWHDKYGDYIRTGRGCL